MNYGRADVTTRVSPVTKEVCSRERQDTWTRGSTVKPSAVPVIHHPHLPSPPPHRPQLHPGLPQPRNSPFSDRPGVQRTRKLDSDEWGRENTVSQSSLFGEEAVSVDGRRLRRGDA
ncbi:hypothetical protein Bbelb_443050 [Branchiostoma belcheri]|nr:hypothetical protein Bbelb_443050 [Branchiostoma belcheri]